jgi:hypothetical protein
MTRSLSPGSAMYHKQFAMLECKTELSLSRMLNPNELQREFSGPGEPDRTDSTILCESVGAAESHIRVPSSQMTFVANRLGTRVSLGCHLHGENLAGESIRFPSF